jgi:hypothetical protein
MVACSEETTYHSGFITAVELEAPYLPELLNDNVF